MVDILPRNIHRDILPRKQIPAYSVVEDPYVYSVVEYALAYYVDSVNSGRQFWLINIFEPRLSIVIIEIFSLIEWYFELF